MSDLADLKKAIEEKGIAVADLRKATDLYHDEVKEHGVAMAETKDQLSKVNAALDEASAAKTAVEERMSALETSIKRGGNRSDKSEGEHAEARGEYKGNFFNYLRKSATDRSDAMDAAQVKAMGGDDAEFKAMAVNHQADGGYLVPVDTSGRIVTVVRESSPMRSFASVQSISTDALDGTVDTDEAEAGWTDEVATPVDTDTPQVGTWKIPTHEMYAKPKATQKLLEDAAVNIEQWLVGKVGNRFARLENAAFVTGNGIGKCTGIMTKTPIYTDPAVATKATVRTVKSGVNGDFTNPDFLVGMKYRLKGDYRGNASWGLSREGIEAARLLRMDDQYVWQAGLAAGQDDRLMGYRVGEFNDLAAFGTGSLSVFFGDISRTYQIVDRLQFSLLRDPYSSKPFVEFYCRRRVGGDIINTDTIVYGELSA